MIVDDGCASFAKSFHDTIAPDYPDAKEQTCVWHETKNLVSKSEFDKLSSRTVVRGPFKFPILQKLIDTDVLTLDMAKRHFEWSVRHADCNVNALKDNLVYLIFSFHDYFINLIYISRNKGLEYLLKGVDLPEKTADYRAFRAFLEGCVSDDKRLERILLYKFTSFNESFHALCNKYCPKSEYVGYAAYCRRKTLARLHWNQVRRDGRSKSNLVLGFEWKIIDKLIKLM